MEEKVVLVKSYQGRVYKLVEFNGCMNACGLCTFNYVDLDCLCIGDECVDFSFKDGGSDVAWKEAE